MRMFSAAAFLLLFLQCPARARAGQSILTSASPAAETSASPVFEFHSGFWVNLHHFLYLQGRVERARAQGVTGEGKIAAPYDSPASVEGMTAEDEASVAGGGANLCGFVVVARPIAQQPNGADQRPAGGVGRLSRARREVGGGVHVRDRAGAGDCVGRGGAHLSAALVAGARPDESRLDRGAGAAAAEHGRGDGRRGWPIFTKAAGRREFMWMWLGSPEAKAPIRRLRRRTL